MPKSAEAVPFGSLLYYLRGSYNITVEQQHVQRVDILGYIKATHAMYYLRIQILKLLVDLILE